MKHAMSFSVNMSVGFGIMMGLMYFDASKGFYFVGGVVAATLYGVVDSVVERLYV